MPQQGSADDGPVTLDDVARAAGVHPSTVSRVLTKPGRINERTAQRVRDAAAELGYEPNRAARRLAGGRIGAIGILVPDLCNPFFARVARAVQAHAQEAGLLTYVVDAEAGPDSEADLIDSLRRNVDGLILCAPTAGSRTLRETIGDRPVVLVNRRIDGLPSVVADQAEAVTIAVDHLRGQGHEHIAYLRGPTSKWVSGIRDRTATALGLTDLGPYSPDHHGGADATMAVTDGGFSAVIAHNDLVAIGLIDGLLEAGHEVPEEVSVVGCDDIEAASLTRPRLSTTAMPLEQLGASAAGLLEELIRDPDALEDSSTRVTLPVEFVERDTTGSPPDHSLPEQR